jgi:DNA-binding NarL/FixJ family response regulator
VSKKRLLVAEDHALLRDGIKSLIETTDHLEVAAEARNGEEAVRLYQEVRPDLVLMDLSMPKVNGIRAIRHIRREDPEARILALTVHSADEYVYSTLRSGADGYVLKDATSEELLMAIDSVLAGKSFISPAISDMLINGYIKSKSVEETNAPWSVLTERELDVLRLVAEGLKNKTIAEKLYISIKTVEKHRSNLMRKLDLHSAEEIRDFALRHSLVPPG